MNVWVRSIPAILIVLVLASCGSDNNNAQGNASSYKDTKSMVLDILKTEDGKKAIKEATDSSGQGGEAGGGQLKVMSTGDTQQLQLAVKDVLTDTNSTKFLTQMMNDPKFAGDFAKAIQKENKQLQKDLMKDPDYQKQMIDLMKNPEAQRIFLDTMKSQQYRQQTMSVIQESMQSPLFRTEMINLMKKAIEEQLQSQSQPGGQSGGKSGGGGSSGNSEKSKEGGEQQQGSG
ncbi:spore gernimation protein [Paenibacillus thalictri]|uniref:Spore gernimation protein n=2 Tax=Paenibacillus thalictri TaxID=2527873 RepID=A0A4Q9DG74_9BACL|nr:spore gernimation protein [Paenibacillus thalictri]